MRLVMMIGFVVLLAGVSSSVTHAGPAAMAVTWDLNGASDGVPGFCYGTNDSFTVSGTYTADAPLGNGTYTGTITKTSDCNTQAPGWGGPVGPPANVTASFTFSSPGGSFEAAGLGTTLRAETIHTADLFTDLSLTIRNGTRRYGHAVGQVHLSLTASSLPSPPSYTSSGQITGSLRIA